MGRKVSAAPAHVHHIVPPHLHLHWRTDIYPASTTRRLFWDPALLLGDVIADRAAQLCGIGSLAGQEQL